MKYAKIKELQTDEIHKKVRESELELIKLNGSVASGTSAKSPGLIKQTKKTIAQLKTELAVRGKK